MISKEMQAKLNEQIKKEYFSSYLYLAMSSWAKSRALEGFSKWLRVQAEEELEHAMKIIGYVEDQNGTVTLEALEQPPSSYKDIQEIFTRSLAHEKFITKSIYDICALADNEKDYATREFLSWFVKEQVEEEANVQLIVDRLHFAGESRGSLLYMDKELGKRAKEKEE